MGTGMISWGEARDAIFPAVFSLLSMMGWYLLNTLLSSVPSPLLKLGIRWCRLSLAGCFLGALILWIGEPGIALWRLIIIGVLVSILAESLYLWVFISVWDRSEIPLFPGIFEKERSEWPANRRFLFIKDWIRDHGYREVQALEHRFQGITLQQSVVFSSPDDTIRLQVMITPDANGVLLDQIVFWSETEDGQYLSTDNVFMPFGGSWPEHWKVQRFPLIRMTDKLADRHAALISSVELPLVARTCEPLDWVLERQRELEMHNRSCGFLKPENEHQEQGKLTGEGRYRLWKEMLLLNYLGLSLC
jgi:hypothetical protein